MTTPATPEAKPPCWLCGMEIEDHPWRLKYEAHGGGERIALFCSHRCKDMFDAAVEERENERKPPPPTPGCSICGMTEDESQWGVLIPIEVTVLEGEEGYADIMMLLCDEHGADVCDALMALGFKDHHHGGANLLEDTDCPGRAHMDDCPTPTNPYEEDGPTLVPRGGWGAA